MDCNFPSTVVQERPSKLRTGGKKGCFQGWLCVCLFFSLLTRLHECHKTTIKKNEGILGGNGW